MRTTVEIDEELLEEARRLLGTRTKRETIRRALEEVIRERRKELLRRKLGNTEMSIDLEELERLRGEG
ncbi:type II toxin-antitoxin system VapB family antitoxin [Candidatus Bipolaricaulota sp. J31]